MTDETDEYEYEFDVFVSYNRVDGSVVTALVGRLRAEGLRPFFDRQLDVGVPWQRELEEALAGSATAAVIVGSAGLGTWQNEELRVALDRAVRTRDEFRVIAVLLPDADPNLLPPFLAQRTWVDFTSGIDDDSALRRLAAAVLGEAIVDAAFEMPDHPAPYRGLWRFETDDAELFFGRNDEVQELIAKLDRGRFVAVVGASGSGKSSLVRAGLIPNLRELRTHGNADWRIMICSPGRDPLRSLTQQVALLSGSATALSTVDELAERLANRDDGLLTAVHAYTATESRPTLLFVDQFEELFTEGSQPSERWRPVAERFVANLVTAVADPAGIWVVITLRADFVGAALSVPGIRKLLQDSLVMLGALSRSELREIIVCPAQKVGAFFEKGLVSSIVRDVDREPGALPLLQHALYELWTARRGPWLTIDAYEHSGGVIGALSSRAQTTYDSLTPVQQQLAKAIFIRLTTEMLAAQELAAGQ